MLDTPLTRTSDGQSTHGSVRNAVTRNGSGDGSRPPRSRAIMSGDAHPMSVGPLEDAVAVAVAAVPRPRRRIGLRFRSFTAMGLRPLLRPAYSSGSSKSPALAWRSCSRTPTRLSSFAKSSGTVRRVPMWWLCFSLARPTRRTGVPSRTHCGKLMYARAARQSSCTMPPFSRTDFQAAADCVSLIHQLRSIFLNGRHINTPQKD